VFTDGTESPWSNRQMVTLFDNGHSYSLGDVDHDGLVSITDVSILIDYLLNGSGDICEICADVDGDNVVNITDVTVLIDALLAN